MLFHKSKSNSMNKTLLRSFYVPALFFFLAVSNPSFAATVPGKPAVSSKDRFRQLSVTAPVNIVVSTDPWSNVASGISLGEPLVSANANTTYTVSNNAPDTYPIGVTNIVWTVTDSDGNTATATQSVTVKDTEKPIIFRMGEISVVNDRGKCGAAVQLMIPGTYDNSGGPVTITSDAPAFFQVGSVIITWTATDTYGNSDTSTQKITVIDNEEPSISVTNININNTAGKCGATVDLGTPLTFDNCGVVTVTNDAPAFFPTGTTLVHWTVTDHVGFTGSATQTVTVNDAEAPVFSGVPANTTVTCDGIPAVATPAVTDNCTAQPTISFVQTGTRGTDATNTAYYNYTITRTWTAKDAKGNSKTAQQVITVVDNTAPVITAPSNINVGNDLNVCGAVVKFTVTATDNCSSPVTLTYSKNPNTLFATGTTTVTVTAKDVSGNTSSKSFTVTVNDTQKPVITAPADQNYTVSTNSSKVSNVNLGVPSTSDNCGVKTITNNAPSSYPVGTTTVTWTVKDAAGNTATDVQNIIVTLNKKRSNNINPASGITKEKEPVEEGLQVTVAPNPSTSYFTLVLKSKYDLPVEIRVFDETGRIVDARSKLGANSTVQIGQNYLSGFYLAEIVQGSQRKTVKLMKTR
jgi:hypothetical protein